MNIYKIADRVTYLFTFPFLLHILKKAYQDCLDHGFKIPGRVEFKVGLAEYGPYEKGVSVNSGRCYSSILGNAYTALTLNNSIKISLKDYQHTAYHEICHGLLNQYQRYKHLPQISSITANHNTSYRDDPEEAICDHFANYAMNGFTWKGYKFRTGIPAEVLMVKELIEKLSHEVICGN